MSTLYNENDDFAASWLEELAQHDHIAQGTVDRRSITELSAADVAGHGQRHFFAGIGGWSLALRLAGVPDDADIWTGSCPCQPFSDAGKGGGTSDPRHLWPTWFALIRECRPPVIFGEQVASRDGLVWLDLVFADLERCGYAVGAADLCAAGVGAPHIRQRLFFVAYAHGEPGGLQLQPRQPGRAEPEAGRRGEDGGVVDTAGQRRERRAMRGRKARDRRQLPGRASVVVADAAEPRLEVVGAPWSDCDWLPCQDGVFRPVEPGTFPLAHGVPGRVGTLRGYGNAIVPQVAAAFIRAALPAIRRR